MLFKYQYVKTYFIWDLMKIWKLTVEMSKYGWHQNRKMS